MPKSPGARIQAQATFTPTSTATYAASTSSALDYEITEASDDTSTDDTSDVPVVTTLTLTLQQAPEGVAVQRFLAKGRDQAEWRAAVDSRG